MSKSPIIFRVKCDCVLRDVIIKYDNLSDDIAAWNELIDNINYFEFQSSSGRITININWKSAKDFINHPDQYLFNPDRMKTEQDLNDAIERFNNYMYLKSNNLIQTYFEIEILIYNSAADSLNNLGYVKNILYQIFLIMNLAIPGSCNFYTAVIQSLDSSKLCEKRLWLSGSALEDVTATGEQFGWSLIHKIPIQKVANWIKKIGFAEAHLAQSRTEWVVYGLLHVCRQPYLSPSEIIWLSQALEALFDTPATGISKALRERAFLVLGESSVNQNKLEKAISSFYNYRSRYVHGELPIPNPMTEDIYNKSTDEFYNKLLQHIDFAIFLIIAALQKLIMHDGESFEFAETVAIKTLHNT